MTFRVTILGTSSAKPSAGRHQTAHVLNAREQFYLIDCGEGVQSRLMQAGIGPLKIDHIFLSHLHGDHLFGLFPLISSMGLLNRQTPLHLYAPRPMDEILAQYFRFFDTHLPFEVVWHETETRRHKLIFENKVMEVWSIPLRHSVPCAGFLFREKQPPLNIHKEAIERYGLGIAQIAAAKRGEDVQLDNGELLSNQELTYRPFAPRSYAYLSDTSYSARAAGYCKGVDLLYHEATYADDNRRDARLRGHSTAAQAAKAALTAEAKQLIIGHFSSRYKDLTVLLDEARAIFPETCLATEGHTYDIG